MERRNIFGILQTIFWQACKRRRIRNDRFRYDGLDTRKFTKEHWLLVWNDGIYQGTLNGCLIRKDGTLTVNYKR
jgi:hypothetical protein